MSDSFTNSGTFTVPTGVTQVRVTVIGGGGPGSCTAPAVPPSTPILSALDRLFAPRRTTGHIEAQILQDAARGIPGRNPAHLGNGRLLPNSRSDDLGRNEPQVGAASFVREIDESFAAWTLAIGLCVTAAGLLGIIATLWWRV